jgi:hypothetical protein
VFYGLQLMGAFSGGIVIALVYSLFRRTGCPRIASLGIALIHAFAYAFWYYTTEVEVYVPALIFIALSALVLFTSDRLGWIRCMVLSLLVAISVYFHQTNILFLPVVLAYGQRIARQRAD